MTLPRMTEVFQSAIKPAETTQDTKPPMGATPVGPDVWAKMGATGQAAQKGFDAFNKAAGGQYKIYSNDQGGYTAFSSGADPSHKPMKLDLANGGIWTPDGPDDQNNTGTM